MKLGDWGRGVSSFKDLNQLITAYNQSVAGHPTPAGQALIAAGLFTEAQLKTLKAVSPTIPLVPQTNPDPFPSLPLDVTMRVSRPIKIENAYIVHNLVIEPYFDVFNLFNYRGHLSMATLATNQGVNLLGNAFGSLNYHYAANGRLAELKDARAFAFGPRIVQLGFRVSF